MQAVLYGILPVAAALVLISALDQYRAGRRVVAILVFIAGVALAAAALTDWQAATVLLAGGLVRWRFRTNAAVLLLAGALFGALSVMWAG